MGKKIKTSIALDEDLIKWIDSQIKIKRFANRTHAIEYAIEQLRREAKTEG
jgi:Arc/MetJ-type ribon-helix-helix transcriptional regulator